MTDITLLITGVVVFGLMLIAMVMTVIEFKQIGKQQEAKLAGPKRDPGDA
jgi:hypothetical protein